MFTEEDSDSDGEDSVLSVQERRKLFEKGILDQREKAETLERPCKQVGKLSPAYASFKFAPYAARPQTSDISGEVKPLSTKLMSNQIHMSPSLVLEKWTMPASSSSLVIPENGSNKKSSLLQSSNIPPILDRKTLPSLSPPGPLSKQPKAVGGTPSYTIDRRTLPSPTASDLYQRKKIQTMSPSQRKLLVEKNAGVQIIEEGSATDMLPVLAFPAVSEHSPKEGFSNTAEVTEHETLLQSKKANKEKNAAKHKMSQSGKPTEKEESSCGCVIS